MPNADLDAVFDQAQAEDHSQKVQSLQGSLHVGRQQDPEKAAQAQQAGVSTDVLNVAPDLATPPGPSAAQITAETPKAGAWLSDVQNASKSHDDIQSLQDVEKTIQEWKKTKDDTSAVINTHLASIAAPGKAALESFTGALGSGVSGLAKQVGDVPVAELTAAQAIGDPLAHLAQAANMYQLPAGMTMGKDWDADLRKQLADNPAARFAAATKLATSNPQFINDQAASIAATWKNDKLGGAALATRKTADLIGTFIPYIAGEILSGGTATVPFAMGAGAEGAADAREKGLDPGAAMANAAGKAGTFFVAGKIGSLMPVQFFQKMLGQQIGDGVAKEVVGSALTAGLKTALKQFYHGTVAGAGLTGGNALTDYLTGADPHALDNIVPRMLETGLMMGVTGPILGAGETVFHERAGDVQDAALTKQHMMALAETTKASVLAKRDPAAWQTFLQEQTNGTHAENLHISPADFDDVFSKHGVEPSAAATDLNVDKAYADAKKYGHDIQVKSADVIAKLADHPSLESFLDKAKAEPGGLNMEGVDKVIKDERNKVRAKQNAFDASLERVGEARKQNLVDTGLPVSQAETETNLFKEFVRKQTAELQRNPGQEQATPEDFVKQMGLTERTPRKLSPIQKAKQILNMETGVQPEPVDEAGLTETERAQLEKSAEKSMVKGAGGNKPISNFIRERGGIRIDTLPKGELEDMQGSRLATKTGKHQHDLMAEMLRNEGLLGPDEDMFEAIRKEALRSKTYRQDPADARPVPEQDEMQRLRDENASLRYRLFTNEKTGLPNLLAFEDAHANEPFDHVVAFDLNNFKAYNTLLGHDAVDKQVFPQLGVTLMKAAKELGLDIYHRSGDEFQIGVRHGDREATEQQIQRLHDRMSSIAPEVAGIDKNTGEAVRYLIKGIEATHGIGKEYKDADATAEKRKSELRAAGKLEDLRETGGVPRNFHRLENGDAPESSGDVQERGGLLPGVLGKATGSEGTLGPDDGIVPQVYQQPAYHGTPHNVHDNGGFSLRKIGTGEGAASYGWGLYFAGEKKVAEGYRERLAGALVTKNFRIGDFDVTKNEQYQDYSPKTSAHYDTVKASIIEDALVDQAGIDAAFAVGGEKAVKDHVLRMIDDKIEGYKFEDYKEGVAAAEKFKKVVEKKGVKMDAEKPGHVYQVDIPDDKEYLSWEKPLSKQSDSVMEKLREAANNEMGKGGSLIRDVLDDMEHPTDPRDLTGAEFYDNLKAAFDEDPEKASKFLSSIGLPGIKYLDQMSRVGHTTHTVQSFDDDGNQTHISYHEREEEAEEKAAEERAKGRKVYLQKPSPGTSNYVVFDDKLVKIQQYEQKNKGNPNADISIRHEISGDPASEFKATVQRFETADLSSGIHELGHYMLESMRRLSAMPNSSDELRSDLATLEKHFEVKDGQWEKSHHEDFAHAWEKYCMEGKAPSAALRPVFDTLRAWMRQVYQHIKAIAGPPLNDDLRAVMDRMLATPDQIELAHNFMGREAWINPTDNPEYAQKLAKAHEQAESQLTYAKNQDMIRQQKQAWQAEYTRNESEVKDEMLGDKSRELAYKAQMAFKGKDFDGEPLVDASGDPADPMRINRKAFDEKIGPDSARILPRGSLTDVGGHDPDVAAQLLGYKTAREMLADMAKVKPFKQELHDRAVALTDFMQPKLTPDRIAELALDAVHNDAGADTLDMEMQTLGNKLGVLRKVLPKTADFKDEARRTVAEIKVGDVNSNTYAVAEARARRESMDAFQKNDMLGLYDALRRERQNHELYRAAMDAKKATQDGLDYLSKFNKDSIREKIDLPFRNQIDALLDQYDLRRWVSKKSLAAKAKLNDFVEGLAADGHVPYIPDSIAQAMGRYEAMGDKAQRVHYKDMQVQDFQGLNDAVKSLDKMGRNQKNISDGKEEQDLADAATAFKTKAAELPQRVPESNRGLNRLEKMTAGVKWGARSLQASLLKMEQMFDWLDGRVPGGEANKYGFRPIAEAGGREKDMQDQIAAHLDEARSQWADATKDGEGKIFQAPSGDGMLDRKLVQEGASLDEARQKLDHKQMLMLAGNFGNRSNIEKMCKGEGWREDVVKGFLDKNMTKADWDFVHQLSKSFEMVYKEKLEMHRRLGNTDPVRVEPEPFETPHGNYPGWYWPLVYDPARSQAVADRGARKGGDLFENTYRRANTESGRDNTRIEGYAAPLLLSLDAIPKILADEIHDTTHREAIMNADKFFSHPDVRGAIVNALSQEHYDQIRPWLQSIANDTKSDMRALKFFDNVAHGMRTITTMTGLGFRATTMVIHGASAAGESIAELGNPKWFTQGLQAFANPKNWEKNRDFIVANSPEMKLRMTGDVDRDMHDSMKDVDQKLMDPTLGMIARGKAALEGRAMQGIAMLDMASALPTWMGGYLKGLAPEEQGGQGLGHEDACYFADKTVRNAHGGGGIKDLAAVQRGPEYFKLLTMFYSFWNHNVNRLMDTGRMAADPETWKDSGKAGQVVMRTLMYVFGVQAIHALFHKDEQADHWYTWAAKAMMGAATGGIPIARNLWGLYSGEQKDFKLSPTEEMLSQPQQTMTDAIHAYEGKHVSDQWVKHAVQTAGYLTGLPGAGQASETAQFLWDVHDGRQDPQGIKEWFNGVVSGHARSK